MYDFLFKGGVYPDYDKKEMVKGDIAVKEGKIVAVGEVEGDAAKVIDATGLVVSPGFIDIHMHEEDFQNESHEYFISDLELQQGVTTCLGGNCGKARQRLAQFLEVVEELGGLPVNYMMQAGYNGERTKLGIGRYEAATQEQIEYLTKIMTEEIEQGCIGISFGLEYDPGITFEEIMYVLNAQPQDDLFVSAHYRDDSTGAIKSIKEMIDIVEQSGKKFQIAHLSSCSAMGQMDEALPMINEAHLRNPKLDYDTYPYAAFSTSIGSAVFDEGCFEQWGKSYENIYMTSGKYANQFCTKETFYEMRRDDPTQYVVAFVMNENEIADAIANPVCGMVASDGIVRLKSGHPRAAGTFARVLGKYVREDKVISLIDALKKMTLTPAKRMDLDHRKGEIKVGMDADIAVFNPDTIIDGATFESLYAKKPEGIEYVLVNGVLAVEHGEIVNARAGVFIPSKYKK